MYDKVKVYKYYLVKERLMDENGEPIQINPGKTWICIVWDEYGQDVVIE